ncbi:hypothetical protein ACWFMI_27350 [Nocardiopsis terrae]
MEMLILAAVAAFWVKNVALDFSSLATGKTPPSHAYRMAKMREKAAKERRRLASDPDLRGGLKMVLRHCYLDACEDLDAWRAHRHATRPQRRAAARQRRQAKERFTSRWGWRKGDPMPDDVIDAEIVDEEEGFTPDPQPGAAPRGAGRARPHRGQDTRTTTTTTTTSSTVTREKGPAADREVVPITPAEDALRPPLPHRRLMLMFMLAEAGFDPNAESIGQMSEDEVDAAIRALLEHERATSRT